MTTPIAVVISGTNPRLDRGASLDVKCGPHYWHPVSYHANSAAALAAYEQLSWLERQSPERWRVACHELDLS
jgi:hypothetical protein